MQGGTGRAAISFYPSDAPFTQTGLKTAAPDQKRKGVSAFPWKFLNPLTRNRNSFRFFPLNELTGRTGRTNTNDERVSLR